MTTPPLRSPAKLTDAQHATLLAIRDGKVERDEHWSVVIGARADVLGRLEEQFRPVLAVCNWNAPTRLVSSSPAFRQRYRVDITEAGLEALYERWRAQQ